MKYHPRLTGLSVNHPVAQIEFRFFAVKIVSQRCSAKPNYSASYVLGQSRVTLKYSCMKPAKNVKPRVF